MANVPFNTLYDQVVPYLPGAESGIIDSQLRKALREFMKRTTLIRQTFTFNTSNGATTYLLTPTFGQVSSVLHVYIGADEVEIPPIPEELRRPRDGAEPYAWYTLLPHLLNFYPQPNGIYAMTVEAAITLKQDDTTFPEELALQHAETIAAGALSLMYSMPGKPWTQGQASKEYGRVFSNMIKTIRSSLRDGGQPNQSTFRGIARFGA